MPQNKNAASRYRIIDSCLRNRLRPFPNKQQLAERIFDKMNVVVSESTIEKDIHQMKADPPEGFSAPIEYHPQRKGYYYAESDFSIQSLKLSEEEWESLRLASALLYEYAHLSVFRYFREAIEKIDLCFGLGMNPSDPEIDKIIRFETPSSFSGYDWLPTIHEAIKRRWLLKIKYENIYKGEIKEYVLQPCLLKEMRNRWYLIGWVSDRDDYLTFAADRVLELEVIEQQQPYRSDFDSASFFENSIGIMEGNDDPQCITIEISAPYDRLVLLNPLHHSQKVISQVPQLLTIEIYVLVNDELYMRLMALGPFARVLSPAAVAEHVKQMFASAVGLYK